MTIESSTEQPEASTRKHRVLLVEDSAIIALGAKQTLELAGFEVIGPASSVAEGLALFERCGADAAILDVNLDGETVYPLAMVLHQSSVPFLFLSGYTRGDAFIPPELTNTECLQKPIREPDLVQWAKKICG